MASYNVLLMPSVKKDIRKITKADQQKILKRIESLAGNPRPYGCEQLSGQTKYRLRQRDYRILYSIDDTEHTVRIIKVGHRRDVYLARENKAEYSAAENQSAKMTRNKT
jgi:mRNA interferase RelE/StbE